MKMGLVSQCVASLLLLITACPLVAMAKQTMVGGYSVVSVTEPQVIAAATFAIKAQATKKKGTKLLLVKILGAQQQVVAGLNFRLVLKVKMNNTEKDAEVVVYRNLSGQHKLSLWIWKSP